MRSRFLRYSAPAVLLLVGAPSATFAQVPTWNRATWNRATTASAEAAPARDSTEGKTERLRKQWLLALEAVTHAPIDMGLRLGIETPPRVRLSGGYGWVPSSYMNLLTGIAASASGNSYARALLDEAEYRGRTWRAQIGFRPWRSLGLYADVGYASVTANGRLDLAESGVPALARLNGGYLATTQLDMWLVELGYQAQLADRLVLAAALGAMGTLDATTSIESVDGAPRSNALNEAATQADSALETYGVVPTLTLRMGFDFI